MRILAKNVTIIQTLRIETFAKLVLFCQRVSTTVTRLVVEESLIACVQVLEALIVQTVLVFGFSEKYVLELERFIIIGELN